MAPKRSAERLLALFGKPASARSLLALAALAALLLCGCGGSGGESATTSGGGGKTSTAATSAQSAQANASDRAGKGQPAPSKTSPGAAGGKQGPHIKQPQGPEEPPITPQQKAQSTVASMSLESPVLSPGPESTLLLPSTYTCDGNGSNPPLRWSGVPAGSEELILLVLALEPVNEAFFFNWAVAGIDPGLTALDTRSLPQGAVVGKNSYGKRGYEICPRGKRETYLFALYAMPERTGAKPGFDPAALREEILAGSHNAGLLAATYGSR